MSGKGTLRGFGSFAGNYRISQEPGSGHGWARSLTYTRLESFAGERESGARVGKVRAIDPPADNSVVTKERDGRRCDECDGPLSVYNRTRQCGSCEHQERVKYAAQCDEAAAAVERRRVRDANEQMASALGFAEAV